MAKGRCESCRNIKYCPVCGKPVKEFNHVGVRSSFGGKSAIWHYAIPCMHRVEVSSGTEKLQAGGASAVYNGGPLWKDGYRWFNVFWGSYWSESNLISQINSATKDIESNPSYSGRLSEYNVGIGNLSGSAIVSEDPPSTVTETDIGTAIAGWVSAGTIPDLNGNGAYNIFLPPGIVATLGSDKSCVTFCDYHDTIDADKGPFFTCEPFPCSSGCNQCSSNSIDTLTQGLSEEMVELETDMNPGTGWIIGDEEICDYCDANFVCNQISTGEYVNAWYSNRQGSCWSPK